MRKSLKKQQKLKKKKTAIHIQGRTAGITDTSFSKETLKVNPYRT